MSKPYIHATSSARRWGGVPEDYLPIHDFMDSSKGTIADDRHRALTHNAWFLSTVLERVFGHNIITSTGRKVSVRDIGEQHVLEDFGGRFIPSAQDYLEGIPHQPWMRNGRDGVPPSFRAFVEQRRSKHVRHGEVSRGSGGSEGGESDIRSTGSDGVSGSVGSAV